MFWTQAKAMAVLAAAIGGGGGGANAQGFLSSLSEQVAAWMIPPAPTTSSSSTSQAGSPPIGGPATTAGGGGDGPPAAAASGTMIISWSTQYFTVTTGGPSPDGSQPTRSISDGGGMDSFPTAGSLDGSLAPGSGGITSGTGVLSSSRDAGSEAGPVITSGGSMPHTPSESLGPSDSISGATAASTISDGLPGESPQPESTDDDDDDDGWIASTLTGSPYTTQDPAPGDVYGSTETPGSRGSSQAEPITDGGGGTGTPGSPTSSQAEPTTDSGGGGSVPPTPTDDGPASSQASVPGTSPSESTLPLPNIFVVQLDPAVAGAGGGAAIESGAAAGPLGRRQDVNSNDDNNEFLMNAGAERSDDCSQATQFHIIDGELTRGGQKVSTGPPGLVGGSAQRLAVSPIVGPITRSWEIVGGELLWLNESFVGGRAAFCVDDDTRAVFFTTLGEGSEPVGCTPQRLTPMFVADCPGLNPDGSIKSLLPAEETLILPPGIYFPGREPKDQQPDAFACRVTTGYWTVGQFTLAPAPTDMSRGLW